MSNRKGNWNWRDTHLNTNEFGNAVFVTPSIKYAALYTRDSVVITYDENDKERVYIKAGEFVKNSTGEIFNRLIIFQVRVKPNSFKEFPSTITKFHDSDPHYTDDSIEWRIENKKDVFPYRVLFKFIPANEFLNSFKEQTLL